MKRVTALAAFAILALRAHAPVASAAPWSVEEVAREAERGALRIKNNSPFILLVFIGGVRVGWIKPFRTELFKGLRDGIHKIYTHSEYGTVAWGPKQVHVPGQLNITVDRATADLDTALAARLYKANRASLVACAKIAERRGESVRGTRVEFEVYVDENGKGTVTVKGEGVGESHLGCLRAVATQWKFDATGATYSLSFIHVN